MNWEKVKKFLDNAAVFLGGVVLVAAICFVDYGLKTDIPETTGYVCCAKQKEQ